MLKIILSQVKSKKTGYAHDIDDRNYLKTIVVNYMLKIQKALKLIVELQKILK